MKRWMIVAVCLLCGCSYLEGEQAPKPRVTVDGHALPSVYRTICWEKDCKGKEKPQLQAPPAKARPGSMLTVSLQHFKAKPAQVYMRNMTTGDRLQLETTKRIGLEVPKHVSRYEMEFVWRDIGGRIIGRSLLQFAVQPKE